METLRENKISSILHSIITPVKSTGNINTFHHTYLRRILNIIWYEYLGGSRGMEILSQTAHNILTLVYFIVK